MKKVVLISQDKIGKNMAGPGIRYFEMAKVLAKHFQVQLLVPDNCDIKVTEFIILSYDSKSASRNIGKLIKGSDIVIAQNLRPLLLRTIKKQKICYIADLYDPLTVEVLEYTKYDSDRQKKAVFNFNYYSLLLQIISASHLLCASSRQRDFYCGILSDQKIINPTQYALNPNLSNLISIAPFGLSNKKIPEPNLKIVKSKIKNLKTDDKIVYWGGGIWNWFDALSVVKAIKEISKERQDIKLFFLGIKHPNPKIKQMEMARKTLDYCQKNDLLNQYVFFNFDWTPYEERSNFLARSTIGISTHYDNLETRFSFRTRVLDYLWAELPMILTEGDSMADLCTEKNLGKVVRFKSVSEIKKAILDLVNNKKEYDQIKLNISRIKKDFYWQKCLENLIAFLKDDKHSPKKVSSIMFFRFSLLFYLAGFRKKFFK